MCLRLIAGIFMAQWPQLRPTDASTSADRVDHLYFFLTGLTLFFTFLIFATIFYFMIKYRRRSEEERPPATEQSLSSGAHLDHYSQLDLRISFSLGSESLLCRRPAASRGHGNLRRGQAMDVAPAASGRTSAKSTNLHIPVDVPVRLTMTSEDVIHDFFVPAFRMKMDVVPGRYTSEWFEATKPGSYHLFCAQYCGTLHSGMTGTIEVMTPTDYAQWLRDNATTESMAQTGQELFTRLGCDTCHLAGRERRRPRAAGQIRKAGDAARRPKSCDGRSIYPAIHPRSGFAASAELSAGDAHVSRTSQRGTDSAIDRLHQIARFGRKDAGAMSTAVAEVPVESRIHYLNANYGIKSWLFTTDHKRIALLYLGSITLMFFIGGAAAVMMRLHLIEPAGALVQPETYNKLFTMHGVVMVFFFLIPSIPATARQFSRAHDDRRS